MGLVRELYPICRSLTGDGVRSTLEVLSRFAPMETREVASGTPVLDWTVPDEWNIRDAWIKGPDGTKIVDFQDSNLHVVGYSEPVSRTLSLAELEPHLHSLEEHPELIPYRTSYYRRTWGFCLPHRLRASLPEGDYEVRIDSSLGPGHLSYGECLLPGASASEVLVHTHVCHPSMCNDNLSGLAVATLLAQHLAQRTLRHTYRFVFLPGTLGAITWLSRNAEAVPHIRAGLVLANLGAGDGFHYKRSRRGDAEIDRTVERVLERAGASLEVEAFSPYGYDERQYCSPGFDLPVGSFSRTPWGRYPEYHTSADDLSFVQPEALAGSLDALVAIVGELERTATYRSLSPHGEPQLGRRGLYGSLGGGEGGREREMAMLWVLNYSDGAHSLADIADRSSLPLAAIEAATEALIAADLLEPVS
jgi:aminopeptidase-like protein